jgi:iron(III) transport system substrate-binding protein
VVTVFSATDRASAEQFGKFFPEIRVESQVLGGRDFSVRVPEERKAGIFSYDVYLSGPTTALTQLFPTGGVLADLRSQFVLPELADDRTWIGNADDWWTDDNTKRYMFNFGGSESVSSVWVNRQRLPEAQFKKIEDLFKPELKGKWCMDDPRVPGRSAATFTELSVTKGEDFVRRLFTETGPVISRDFRAMAEDLIRGTMLVCIGAEVGLFHEQGVGLHVQRVPVDYGPIDPKYRGAIKVICCGSGVAKTEIDGVINVGTARVNLSLLDRPPHPHAAKAFANWVLTKEAQQVWYRPTDTICTMREDLRAWCDAEKKDPRPVDGKAYITFHRASNVRYREVAQQLAQQVFGR